jgi:hypothetical protein
MGLIDIDYFRRQPLGLKGAQDLPAETLQEYIDEASDYVEDYLDIKVLEHDYVERIVGPGGYTIILDAYPITDLVSVGYEGFTESGLHLNSDFLVHADAGIIEWVNKANYFRSDRIYIVSYTAGYETVPNPIKRAVALQTVQLLRPMYGGPQLDTPEIVPFADEMIVNLLERYRRKRLS